MKSAETFVTAPDGTRYSIPGDFATVEADGTITLLGRGSVSINSGGEKIYPEEVEGAVKAHPGVYDCTVVGLPDERFGQRVAAVVQPREGTSVTLESIQEHCRTLIAGYKVPRELHLVDTIQRSPSGKPDYRWAAEIATSAEVQSMRTSATEMFGIDLPIFAFSHCRDVVAAVSKAGRPGRARRARVQSPSSSRSSSTGSTSTSRASRTASTS